MKLAELFFGEAGSMDCVKDAIIDLSFYLKEQGIVKIDLEKFILMLQDIGINDFVTGDEDSLKELVDVLNDMPNVVTSATVDEISFKDATMPDAVTDKDKAQDAVAKAADSANPLT
jgi:hypothetical protein